MCVCVCVLVCQSPLKVEVELRMHVAWFAPASAANIRLAPRLEQVAHAATGSLRPKRPTEKWIRKATEM